jgi:hypothetical protein
MLILKANSLRRRFIFSVPPLVVAILLGGCGVKGKPLPPQEPAYIGNGKPLQEKTNLKNKNEADSKKENEDVE